MYKHLSLDAFCYVSLPSLTFAGMLKKSSTKLHLITDDISWMYSLITSNIRGGLAVAATSYCRANNPSVPGFNPKKYPCDIVFLDFCSLYAHCMSSNKMPTHGFRRLSEFEEEKIFGCQGERLQYVKCDGDIGYFLFVDTHIPEQVRLRTASFPLAISNMNIPESFLSPYQKDLLKRYNIPYSARSNKRLICSHLDQSGQLYHIKLLQLLVKLGMKVTNVYYVIEFHQSNFMKEYIDHNVQGRRDTTDPVRRSVHKMCNNALYGRSLMQNSRYNKEVSIVDNELAFQTKVMSPYYINAIPLNEKRLMVVNQKPNILQNSPIF